MLGSAVGSTALLGMVLWTAAPAETARAFGEPPPLLALSGPAELDADTDALSSAWLAERPPHADPPSSTGPDAAVVDPPSGDSLPMDDFDAAPAEHHDHPIFNGRPIRPVRTLRMLVTAYSPDERSCGKFADNITASGYSVWTNGMKLVAADAKLFPFGTVVTVPGYDDGRPVPVLDRGGRIKGPRLDVLLPTHEIARQWGVRWLDVTIWEYAEGASE